MYLVYKHTTPNNKVYIGITKHKNPKRRWENGKGYWSNEHFTNAIKKYGWDNIKHEVLYTNLSKEEAEEKEKELIRQYKSYNRKYGYNIEKGGSLNKEVSKETRNKLRINATGKKASEETKTKMSESHKGKNCYWYGKHLSEATKKALSEIRKKKVNQYTVTGEYIKTYDSMKDAAQEYNVSRQNIYASCSKRRKTACGYIWRYANE